MTDCKMRQCWCKDMDVSKKDKVRESLRIMQDRIEAIEEYMKMEDRVTASDVLCRLTLLEDLLKKMNNQLDSFENAVNTDNEYADDQIQERLSKLEKDYRDMMSMPNVIWAKYNKTPYKCPVCKGLGNPDITENTAHGPRRHMIENDPCNSCHGKGIIWG